MKNKIITRLKEVQELALHARIPATAKNAVQNAYDRAIQIVEEEADGWIPVEDRLPECTRKTTDGLPSSDVVLVTTIDDYGFITSSVDFLIGNMWAAKMPSEKVIAWRPLPEPYRKGE